MGVLVSAVAVRSADADEVLDVFLSMMRGLGHRREPVAGPDRTSPYGDSNDVLCAAPGTGWATLVPHYVVPAEKLAIELTRRLDTVSSAVTIYEDVLWMHHLVERGEELDRFVNLPGYFGPGEFDDSWTGDASLVARTVGMDPAELAPYFRQVPLPRARSRWRRPPKAHAEDDVRPPQRLGGHRAVAPDGHQLAGSCRGPPRSACRSARTAPTRSVRGCGRSSVEPSSSRRRLRYAVSAVLPASSMAVSYAARDSLLRPSRRSRSARVAWKAW